MKLSVKGIKAVSASPKTKDYPVFLNDEATKPVRKLHSSLTGYEPTPLVVLDKLAKELGVKNIYVKDESKRFSMNAFKALGATYAMARVLCDRLGVSIDEADFNYFKSEEVKAKIADLVFVTATDGNHGRAVAWTAQMLGCKSVVYMPKGSSRFRLDAILSHGSDASITEFNYDDAVRLACKMADENGWIFVQDTAFEGYEEIPNWITQGYTTMAYEANKQILDKNLPVPTHIFLQAGVGSMAGAVLGYFANKYEAKLPKTIIVEPDAADCIYKSAEKATGEPVNVGGDLSTIMAGLACGEPNTVTWQILRDFAHAYVSCPDYVTVEGMKALAHPMGGDEMVISGESGAVGIGLLSLISKYKELDEIKKMLEINEDSSVLFFSTEGDTDPENYIKCINETTELDFDK